MCSDEYTEEITNTPSLELCPHAIWNSRWTVFLEADSQRSKLDTCDELYTQTMKMPLTQTEGKKQLKHFRAVGLHFRDWKWRIQPSPKNEGRKVSRHGSARASYSLRDKKTGVMALPGDRPVRRAGQAWGSSWRQPQAQRPSQVHGDRARLRPGQDIRLQARPGSAGPRPRGRAGEWYPIALLGLGLTGTGWAGP